MLQCDMERDCTAPVTHIEEKGWVYCEAHAKDRRTYVGHRIRKLRTFERKLLESGKPLPSYRPLSKAETLLAVNMKVAL